MALEIAAHNSLLPLYLAWQLKPNSSDYHINISYRFTERADVDQVLTQLHYLVNQKAYLRQTFYLKDEQLMVRLHHALPPQIEWHEINGHDLPSLEQQLIKNPHRLNTHSAIQLHIMHVLDSHHYVMLFNIHHILMDGMTINFFFNDLNTLLSGKDILFYSAEDHIRHIQEEPALLEPSMSAYWNQVQSVESDINLSTRDAQAEVLRTHAVLPDALKTQLIQYAEMHGLSLFYLLLLVYAVFMSLVFDEEHMLIEYPVNIRKNRKIPGCFINMVSVPFVFSGTHSFNDHVERMKFLLVDLKNAACVRKPHYSNKALHCFSTARIAQYQNLFVNGMAHEARTDDPIAHSNISTQYRIGSGKLLFFLTASEQIAPKFFLENFLERFFYFLNHILNHSDQCIMHMNIVFPKEKKIILEQWSGIQHAIVLPEKTIHQLFEEQVQHNPHAIALVYEDQLMTYQDLNDRADRVASALRALYIQCTKNNLEPDTAIPLYTKRSMTTIVGMLGILKTGAAYVPIRLKDPNTRIQKILDDTSSRCLVTSFSLTAQIRSMGFDLPLLYADDDSLPPPSEKKTYSLYYNLSCVLYTSGTTGQPKGVLLTHYNIISLVDPQINYFQATAQDTFILLSDLCFDACIFEIWCPLLNGASLYIPKDPTLLYSDVSKLKMLLQKKHITFLWLTKTLFDQLSTQDQSFLKNLNVLVGGEALNPEISKQLVHAIDGPHSFINGYGPTENTTFSCTYRLKKDENPYTQRIPIGKPIPGRFAFVLNRYQQLMPPGLAGELYVGGFGLARGYLNQEDFTHRAFIQLTLDSQTMRVYRTGDHVSWLPDGNLDYHKRCDTQIKINGYRIELSEIEHVLCTHPKIDQSAVVYIKQQDQSSLVAYCVSSTKLQEQQVLKFLMQHMPSYMVPNRIIQLDQLPATPQGKLDRSALPATSHKRAKVYTAPRTPQEILLCAAFGETLGVTPFGMRDDFFKYGGNSLKAIALLARLQKSFVVHLADIFESPTPAQLMSKVIFEENALIKQLKSMRAHYVTQQTTQQIPNQQRKLNAYLNKTSRIQVASKKKSEQCVVLTGVPGFLGCALLKQLLVLSSHRIILLIRAGTVSLALERVQAAWMYYFDSPVPVEDVERITIYPSHLEHKTLGLSEIDYHTLMHQADSIIHAAALTTHCGSYEQFYAANVQATINLLELCAHTRPKEFHYISTVSVLNQGYVPHHRSFCFTEEDSGYNVRGRTNVYVRSKYEAEQMVAHYRSHYGVMGSIYRIGNLAFMHQPFKIQKNWQDNGFFYCINYLLKCGLMPEHFHAVQISPVDETAHAIVLLFDQEQQPCWMYHVFSQHSYDLAQAWMNRHPHTIKKVGMIEFLDFLLLASEDKEQSLYIDRFLLHQGWLGVHQKDWTQIRIRSDQTEAILRQLGFEWKHLSPCTIQCAMQEFFDQECPMKHLSCANPKILEELENVASVIPAAIYWINCNHIILGVNQFVLDAIGLTSSDQLIGKTAYDLYPKDMANHITQHNELVFRTGKVLSQEEKIQDVNGIIKYYMAIKNPIYDENGQVIGLIGNSIEITTQKEAERLALENAEQKTKLDVQEQFQKIVQQASHDICSPLTSLKILARYLNGIEESQRLVLHEIANSIERITKHLMIDYSTPQHPLPVSNLVLVSVLLSQLMMEKSYQYKHHAVTWQIQIEDDAQFACVHCETMAMKRTLSNLINNAVDAFDGQAGTITIHVRATTEQVQINIQDTGKGIPSAVLEKLRQQIAVTADKVEGHGIGMTQVHDTLNTCGGVMAIDSQVGQGTTIGLKLPRIPTPFWILTALVIAPHDQILILDDDSSIHHAWDARFQSILAQHADLRVRHFETGQALLSYVNSVEKKEDLLILIDFELLNQKRNGLEILRASGIKRACLVTSHWMQPSVQALAHVQGVPILPKQLAEVVPIVVAIEHPFQSK